VINPSKTPLVYDGSANPGSRWRTLADHFATRDYHSTAVLTPSGKIVCGGGEWRKFLPDTAAECMTITPPHNLNGNGPWDFEVFTPDYLRKPGANQPVIIPPSPWEHPDAEHLFHYGQTAVVSFDFAGGPEQTIDRVVLTRPGSVTHHADTNQRCVRLNFTLGVPTDGKLTVNVPTKVSGVLPRGIYMLWLQSLQGEGDGRVLVPSQASWVMVMD
jgi:hypothetical protein